MLSRHSVSPRLNRGLRIESLETRSMLSATPITPADAIKQLTAQAAAVTQQNTQLTNSIHANENGLMYVVRQLDAANFQQIQTATQQHNTMLASIDLQERMVILSTEQRITNEFNTEVTTLNNANATFQTQTTALVTGVARGTIPPATALATQATDLVTYQTTAATTQAQSINLVNLELVNVAGLTYTVEGFQGQKSLGLFRGKFDIQGPGSGGLLQDYQGIASERLTVSASLLQGYFTGATGDYLQGLDTSGPTPKLDNMPITGGTILATISQGPDAQGFTIHGTITMQFGSVGGIPAHSAQYQISANLTGNHFLVGQIMLNGQKVGNLNWVYTQA